MEEWQGYCGGRTAPLGRCCGRNPIGIPFLRIEFHIGLKQIALSLYRKQRYLELESGVKEGKERVRLDLRELEGRATGLGYGSRVWLSAVWLPTTLWVWQDPG